MEGHGHCRLSSSNMTVYFSYLLLSGRSAPTASFYTVVLLGPDLFHTESIKKIWQFHDQWLVRKWHDVRAVGYHCGLLVNSTQAIETNKLTWPQAQG